MLFGSNTMNKRSKLAFICFGILFAFVVESIIASAVGVQLICLREREVLELSQCNPDIDDYICRTTTCQMCVNEIRTGVYCQASPNDCNNGGSGPCTYIYEEQNTTQQNSSEVLPIITLINPTDKYYQSEAGDMEFSFKVTDSSKMEICSLIVNNEPVASKSHPIYLTTQKLYYTPASDGTYEWSIECAEKDIYGGVIISSESRVFSINETLPTAQNDTQTQYYDIILDSPADGFALEGEQQVTFTYGLGANISQEDIQECSLIFDGNAVSVSNDNLTQFVYNLVLGSHSWKIECSALDTNLTSAVRTIAINSPPAPSSGGGGGGGGGGGSSAQTYTLNEQQISSGYTKALKVNDKIKFTIAKNGVNETHTITATKVLTNNATLQIKSDPIDATMNIGETKKIDMDLDGVYDLLIILNKILNNRADVTVQTINEEVPGAESPELNKEAQTTEENQGNSTGITAAVIGTIKDNGIPIFIVALTIICIIAVLFYPRKKKIQEQKK